MQRESNAAVFIGMTYPWGLIRHFALLGVELYKRATLNMDVYYASIYRDADRGAWGVVHSEIPESKIIRGTTFAELLDRISSLCATYEKVLIHCGGGWGQMVEFISLRKRVGKHIWRKIRIVVTTHSFNNGTWKRIPTCLVQLFLYLSFADMVVFPCSWIKGKFIGSGLLSLLGKTSVVPLGCEGFPSSFTNNEVPDSIKAAGMETLFGKDTDSFKFIYLAAFRRGKMHEWLVSAIAPALEKHENAYLLLCGVGDREIIQRVRGLIKKLDLEEKILLPGQIPREDVPWLLSRCDSAIVPSRSETFGHCFLEPMFAGIPVLGTHVGIGMNVIQDNMTGRSFNLSSASSLVESAEWMIENRSSLRQMGNAAKELVEARYTHAKVATQLISLYAKVLNIEETQGAEHEECKVDPETGLIRYLMGLPSNECAEFRSQVKMKNYDSRVWRVVEFLLLCRERSAPIEGDEVKTLDSLLRGEK